MIFRKLRRSIRRRPGTAAASEGQGRSSLASPRPASVDDRLRELFDGAYYGETYEDVAALGVDRFDHYMRFGWREGRNPARDFDTLFYRDMHLAGACENPLMHYARTGEALGLSTRPIDREAYLALQGELCAGFFSEADYRQRSGFAGDDALAHYLRSGWRQGIAPSSLFDPEEYLSRHRFLGVHDISPLYHHASQHRAGGGEPPLSLDLFVQPALSTLLRRDDAPVRPVKRPRLVELETMPDYIRQRLEPIWESGQVGGQPISAYRFADVYVAGEGLVFTADGQLIDVTRTHHIDRYVREGALAVATARKKGSCETIEAGVLAENRGARNYGHFLLEMLPRAWFARTQLGCGWPAIIHGRGSPTEQVSRQALHCVGFAPDEIVAVGRDPVFVRELIYVDGLARHPLHISPTALLCFNEIAARIPAGDAARIYASRGAGAARDFADEPAIAAALGTAGFARVATGGMSFEAQVALFAGASHVAGVTGAALTNLLFCRPGTRVTVFSPTGASEVLFWLIAESRGLDFTEVRCREVGPQRGDLPWDRAIDVAPADALRLVG